MQSLLNYLSFAIMQFHSPSLLTLTTSKPHSSNLLVTISTLSWIIPDVIKYPFGLITLLTSSVKIQIISAIMLATTISALPSITSIKFPCKISILSMLLKPTFSLLDSTATYLNQPYCKLCTKLSCCNCKYSRTTTNIKYSTVLLNILF